MPDESELGGEFTLAIFKLNGQMLAAGEKLARPAGITVAWWQVLGAVLRQPLSAAGVARQMGITRQAVQRVANRLIAEGLLEASPNPAHKTSPLLMPTPEGRVAVKRIKPDQTAFSKRLIESFGRTEFQTLISELARISTIVDEAAP
ncbi:MAG: MarR family transcriptional regulator [bacterium]|nr:MarR family transcriptional regulator [bacterium]